MGDARGPSRIRVCLLIVSSLATSSDLFVSDVHTDALEIEMGLPADMDVDFRLGGHSASRAATEQPVGVGSSPNLKRVSVHLTRLYDRL